MGLIIVSIILTIATVIGIGLYCIMEDYKLWWSLLGFLWLLLIVLGCFTKIGANQVGIMYNPFKGGVQDEVLGEGFKSKTPFDKIYKIC